jgi:hypothetical protein
VKSLVSGIALAVVVIFTGAAHAADDAPQPLNRVACDQAGMKWNDRANVCGARKHHGKEKKAEAKKKGEGKGKDLTQRPPQPLTRDACQAAGKRWNERSNVCGMQTHHHKMKKKKRKAKHKAKAGKKH